MNLDDFKDQWAAYDKKLDLNIRLNARLLQEAGWRKANSALQRLSRPIWVELALGVATASLTGLFMARHFKDLPFLIPALALHLFVVFQVAFSVYQLVTLNSLDFGAPVLASQKKLTMLRVKRIRVTMWTFLFSPLLWVPLLIVALKGLLNVNAYVVFDAAWLVTNVLFGLAVIPLMLWGSKRYADRLQGSPFIQSLMDDIAGHSLKAATAFLNELSDFEREAERL